MKEEKFNVLEINNLKTQLELRKKITRVDGQILYQIQAYSSTMFHNTKAMCNITEGDTVTITREDFNSIKEAFLNLSSDSCLPNICSWIEAKCILPKELYEEVLSTLG